MLLRESMLLKIKVGKFAYLMHTPVNINIHSIADCDYYKITK